MHALLSAGECYQEDVTITGLPGDSFDTLALPDVVLLPASAAGGSPAPANSSMHRPDAPLLGPAAGAAAAAAPGTGNSSHVLTLVNSSASRHYRFKWPDSPHLKFSPSVGHLHAGACKRVSVAFATAAPLKLDGHEVKLALSQISYKARARGRSGGMHASQAPVAVHAFISGCCGMHAVHAFISVANASTLQQGEAIDWDDVLALSMIASGLRATSATHAATGLPGSGPKLGSEPLVDLVPKTQRDLLLKVRRVGSMVASTCVYVVKQTRACGASPDAGVASLPCCVQVQAAADTPRYECSAPAPAIVFKPTMMFQTRTFGFNLANPALTALEYAWELRDKQGNPDASGASGGLGSTAACMRARLPDREAPLLCAMHACRRVRGGAGVRGAGRRRQPGGDAALQPAGGGGRRPQPGLPHAGAAAAAGCGCGGWQQGRAAHARAAGQCCGGAAVAAACQGGQRQGEAAAARLCLNNVECQH